MKEDIILLFKSPKQFIKKVILYLSIYLPDKMNLKINFRLKMGKKLDLDNPKTYNEKLQWLKLYDRKPEYTNLVDKYEVKKIVADLIGEEYIIPTLGIWDSADDIDFEQLPDQFVLKCTHDSGGIVICKDKSSLDQENAREIMRKGLKRRYYKYNREWPYKNVKPRIIAEKYMVDESGYELKDYKWFCFDGEVKALFIAKDRGVKGRETTFDFFDSEFNHLPFTNGHPNAKVLPDKPAGFEKMKEIASKLSKGFCQLRVDLYDINGHVYFGELTFFHWGGRTPFVPEEWDYKFGEWIKLPQK